MITCNKIEFASKEDHLISCNPMKTTQIGIIPYLHLQELETELNTTFHADMYGGMPTATGWIYLTKDGTKMKLPVVIRCYESLYPASILGKQFGKAEIRLGYLHHLVKGAALYSYLKEISLNVRQMSFTMPIVNKLHEQFPTLGTSVTNHIKKEVGDIVKGVYFGQTGVFVDFTVKPSEEFCRRLLKDPRRLKFKLFLNGKSFTGTKQILYDETK